jgi:hypothetical protein
LVGEYNWSATIIFPIITETSSDVGGAAPPSWLPSEESSYKLGVLKALGYGAFAGGMSLMGYASLLCVLW